MSDSRKHTVAATGNNLPEPLAGLVEVVWDALKQRVCADPQGAKRCVMVGKDDLAAALHAIAPALEQKDAEMDARIMELEAENAKLKDLVDKSIEGWREACEGWKLVRGY